MTLLTALYNVALIVFIALHLAVGGALTFGVGIYAGIYLSQNYQIPRVDEPKVVWEKIQSLMEQYKKPPPGDK
ncbi:hypothetical protein GHT06_012046 [Daphnia sinensis]|uniref:Uncharacterized protein n=1 Tax=Daphnia sinensis TaxID=1820382 RepID=A0AAD5PZH9_9CRUS|nr:hypothetical protein GHT06_012046 [Daphnia sinensis]